MKNLPLKNREKDYYLFKPIISDNNLPFFNSLMIWLSFTFTLKVATIVS